jgi:hypothetical protein
MVRTLTTLATDTLPRLSNWTIVGYGSGSLIGIDLATGRVTIVPGSTVSTEDTPPTLISIAGLTYVGGWGAPGWLVPDSGPAELAPHGLFDANLVLPGPNSRHLWMATVSHPGDLISISLVDWQGRGTGTSISVPPYLRYGSPSPDGGGYVLVQGVGGYYDLTPDATRLVTHGLVLAVGATGFLAYECGDGSQCQGVVIDRHTWSRRLLPSLTLKSLGLARIGSISADGRRAAFLESGGLDTSLVPQVQIIDLASGASTAVPAAIDQNAPASGSLRFSPDGRHLVVILEGGNLGIIDAATGRVRTVLLPGDVPRLLAITTRTSE